MEFEATMMPVLTDCSRQKLRSFHMNLLKYGSNVNERITTKEIVAAFQETNLKLPGRALQLISEVYVDGKGVDFGRLYRRLEVAQHKTRRDSVLAMQLVGDRSQYNQVSEDAKDADLLRRIEEQLLQCPHYFELESYRAACLKLDLNKSGKLPLEEMSELARTNDLPIYGALLTNLLKRCDDEKIGSVSWPEFMNFLLKAMTNYRTNNPDKPKPGSNRPKLERDGSMSRRPSQVVNLEGTGRDEEKRLSQGAKLLQHLTDKIEGAANIPQEETTLNSVHASSPPKGAGNLVKAADRTNGPPVKEYVIRGQPVRLVVPADLIHGSQSSCDPPTQRLKLDWVYGYSGREVKHNAHILSNGDLMYAVAHIVVLLNMQGDCTQRHYKEHTSMITCVCVHSDKVKVASGQSRYLLNPAQIRVWRSDSLQTVCVLEDKAYIVNCYTHLTFCVLQGAALTSIDRDTREVYGNQLLVGEQRDAVHVSVWDVGSKSKTAQTPLNTLKLCSLQFNPIMPLLVVTLGREHFQWWRLDRERGVMDPANEPRFGTAMKAQQYRCSHHTPTGDFITGDSNGTIYVWLSAANNLSNLIKHAHEGSIVSLTVVSNTLVTCGTDGFMKMWKYGYHMDKLMELRLNEEGHIMTLLHNDGMLLLGTSSNSLISYSIQLNALGHVIEVTFENSFAKGVPEEIISVIPQRNEMDQFICVGSSGSIAVYDSDSRSLIGCATIKDVAVSSVDFCESAGRMAVGCRTGRVLVMNTNDLELDLVVNLVVARSKVSHVAFSPSGAMLAATCRSTVYFVEERGGVDVEREWVVVGKVKVAPSSGALSHIDWSVEKVNGSHLLRVYCAESLQVTLYDSMTLCEVTSLEPLHSCSWTSRNFPLSYSVAGVWHSKQCVETGPRCLDIDSEGRLVAVCSRQGYLCLFQHPCTETGAFSHTYRCHIQPAHVCFTSNDLVLTSGGADVCIMQWKIV